MTRENGTVPCLETTLEEPPIRERAIGEARARYISSPKTALPMRDESQQAKLFAQHQAPLGILKRAMERDSPFVDDVTEPDAEIPDDLRGAQFLVGKLRLGVGACRWQVPVSSQVPQGRTNDNPVIFPMPNRFA